MVAISKAHNNYAHARVERYFVAWQTYDCELLRSIFAPTARYIIRNKQRTYSGIEEIEQYWQRNKKRQKNIRLYWKVIQSYANTDEVEFSACFNDVEEQTDVKVFGRIVFTYNSSKQIVRLSEAYRLKLTAQYAAVPLQHQQIFA